MSEAGERGLLELLRSQPQALLSTQANVQQQLALILRTLRAFDPPAAAPDSTHTDSNPSSPLSRNFGRFWVCPPHSGVPGERLLGRRGRGLSRWSLCSVRCLPAGGSEKCLLELGQRRGMGARWVLSPTFSVSSTLTHLCAGKAFVDADLSQLKVEGLFVWGVGGMSLKPLSSRCEASYTHLALLCAMAQGQHMISHCPLTSLRAGGVLKKVLQLSTRNPFVSSPCTSHQAAQSTSRSLRRQRQGNNKQQTPLLLVRRSPCQQGRGQQARRTSLGMLRAHRSRQTVCGSARPEAGIRGRGRQGWRPAGYRGTALP